MHLAVRAGEFLFCGAALTLTQCTRLWCHSDVNSSSGIHGSIAFNSRRFGSARLVRRDLAALRRTRTRAVSPELRETGLISSRN